MAINRTGKRECSLPFWDRFHVLCLFCCYCRMGRYVQPDKSLIWISNLTDQIVVGSLKINYVSLKINLLPLVFFQQFPTDGGSSPKTEMSPCHLVNRLTQEQLPLNWSLFRPLIWASSTVFAQIILQSLEGICGSSGTKSWRCSSISGCSGWRPLTMLATTSLSRTVIGQFFAFSNT